MRLGKLNEGLEAVLSSLVESMGMDSAQFCKALEQKAKIGDKYLHCNSHNRYSDTYDSVIITFVNLPKDKPMGGVNEMNNRYQITVDGFGRKLGEGPPKGKVRAKELSGALSFKRAGLKLRGKTATPEKMVDYIANFLGKLAKTEPNIR